jgi:NADH-quinone oxidoreductase subunit L
MVNPLLLPVPFLAVMLISLLWPRKGKAFLGYLGSVAGIITLFLIWSVWGTSGTTSVAWFELGRIAISWTVLIDHLSLLLVAIVAGIGSLIFLYSVGYLEPTEDLKRFYAVLALFAASMIGVVTSDNLFQLFFSWELVGLSSYLLIGFWHHKPSAVAAARKAFLTIIVGDAFLLTGIFLLWQAYGTFSITAILASLSAIPGAATGGALPATVIFAGVCIIVGAISKSAQFPLHAWLPDAMEGPTPVSAYLHSATMVKAGLFLIARFLPLLILAGLSPVLLAIAIITIIMSACMALVENDLKRVLAYSTMNQLAFILLALSFGTIAATTAGLYHLLNHSIFKALLFMAAGVIIHLSGTQDLREIAKRPLRSRSLLGITALIGVLALAGIPPLNGFFSKDVILELVLERHDSLLTAFFIAAAGLSAAYIFRWYFLIFRNDGFDAHYHWQLRAPLPLLASFALIGGALSWPFFAWQGVSYHLGIASVIGIAAAAIGACLAYLAIIYDPALGKILADSAFASVFRARFLVDDVMDMLARTVTELGCALKWFDEHVIDRGVLRFGSGFVGSGIVLRRAVSGKPTAYVYAVATGVIIILLLVRFA